MSNIKQNKVELLAPAGGMKQLVAAVENGADAVYLGGTKFNARINAGNFSIDEIRDAVCYAHPLGVKIFVTLNILIKDEELQEALQYVADLYEIGVDAIIVQDIGLAYLIKKHIPNMPMHLSTQGSIYNRSGVKNALNLGFERVVLARELTLDEIKETTDLCEIEIFVHGALCMCYSGQCQMSRAIGSRSGNRGECAQPCRLPYTDDSGSKGYFLSPKDLCMIGHIGELIEAGVASLKIEGRMKSPEYVATVVGIYRKYIDEYYKKGKYTVSEEDRTALLQIFNRGGFTEGYIKENPKEKLLSGRLPKHQGIKIGKVVKNREHNLIEATFETVPEIGDGIEIRDKEVTGNILTYIMKEKNGNYTVGDFKGAIGKGADIYRTSSKALMDKAKTTFEHSKRKTDIGMVFTGITGYVPTLTVYNEDFEVTVDGKDIYEKAINKPLDEDKMKKQLGKTGNTPFEVKYMTVSVDGEGTMPLSAINEMRREGVDALLKAINRKREEVAVPKINVPKLNITKEKPSAVEYSNITKGNEDLYIMEHIEGEQVILNNLSWIDEFKAKGVKVYGGAGLNVMNGAAQKYFENIDVEIVDSSQETKEQPTVLMTTEHPIQTRYLVDRKGQRYNIEKSRFGDKYYIKK